MFRGFVCDSRENGIPVQTYYIIEDAYPQLFWFNYLWHGAIHMGIHKGNAILSFLTAIC